MPAGEDRTIFALPWYGRALIGTTDRDYDGRHRPRRSRPATTSTTCSTRSTRSSALELGRADLTGAYAGVRPLISTGDPRKSVDISRKAELYETSSGLLTITGGKLTTWRRMAKQVVDRMVEREGREAPCRTADIPLGMPAERRGPRAARRAVAEADLPDGWRELLAFRYGHAARNVLARSPASAPSSPRPIVAGQPDLLAEAVIAARLEQARSVADVLLRRTRLGLAGRAPAAHRRLRRAGRRGDGGRARTGTRGASRPRREHWPDAARPRASTRRGPESGADRPCRASLARRR